MIEMNKPNTTNRPGTPVKNQMNNQYSSCESLKDLDLNLHEITEEKYEEISQETTETTYHIFFYHKRTKFLLSMIMHLLIQISFISLLEPLLFFNYISKIEKNIFYHELHSISTSNEVYTDSEIIRNEIFYSYMIQYLQDQNIYIDPFYNNLLQSASQELHQLENTRNYLKYKAYHFTIISWCSMFVYLLLFKYLYPKKKIIKYFSHHIILIFMIGLYEIWLFTNIILKYVPWSKAEIELYIFKCFWANTISYYPELKCMENNVTITC